MVKRGLLSRIAAESAAEARHADVLESILEHLRVLLNARHGSASTHRDFGVADFTDTMHLLPYGTVELCDSLRRTIQTFEPRLTGVSVRPAGEHEPGSVLHFEITARLAETTSGRRIRFATRVRPGGRIEVA